MKNKKITILVIIICLLILLVATIFSLVKFRVINPFSSCIGMLQILFTEKEYVVAQRFPYKVVLSKPHENIFDDYMKKEGFFEIDQFGSEHIYSNGDTQYSIYIRINRYYRLCVWNKNYNGNLVNENIVLGESKRIDKIKIEYTDENFETKEVVITEDPELKQLINIFITKYDQEPCEGIFTHKITFNDDDVYYLLEDCGEINKDGKQAKVTNEQIQIIKNIIENNKISSTSSYIPDNLNRNKVVGNYVSIDSKNTETENNSSLDNVSIKIDENTITSKKVSIIITNDSPNKITYGEDYKVQKNNDGNWEYLTQLPNTAWNSIGYFTNEYSQTNKPLIFEYIYGELDSGTYRIIKSISDVNGNQKDIYSNEFIIK